MPKLGGLGALALVRKHRSKSKSRKQSSHELGGVN